MKIREARAKEEREVQQETVKQGRAIENHLGIDLADPQVSDQCLYTSVLKEKCPGDRGHHDHPGWVPRFPRAAAAAHHATHPGHRAAPAKGGQRGRAGQFDIKLT